MTRPPKPKRLRQTEPVTINLIPRHLRNLEALAKALGTKPATLAGWLAAYVAQPGVSEETRATVEHALAWGELIERGERPPADPAALDALREAVAKRRSRVEVEIRQRLARAGAAELPILRAVAARELRDEHAYTYAEIAAVIGVSKARVQQYLTGGG